MGVQQFIEVLKAQETEKKAQKRESLNAEFELKLLKAQIEFRNSAIAARREIGLNFEIDIDSPTSAEINELENSIQNAGKSRIFYKRHKYGFIWKSRQAK